MDELYEIISKEEESDSISSEIYTLVDEYNAFVVEMDKKLDKVVSRAEAHEE